MQKFLSIFTAGLVAILLLPFASLGGYAIGLLIGSEIHHKGDMGTGIQVGLTLFFGLPIAIAVCAGGILLINKILKDLYDKIKINKIKYSLVAGLTTTAFITGIFVIYKDSLYNY